MFTHKWSPVTTSHRTRTVVLASFVCIQCVLSAPVLAQGAPGTHQDNSGINGSLSHGDLEKLSG
ncbi:MAG: hypothetical protein ABJC66_14610, partial [Gammaproteobacteria bacterium]